MTRRRPPAGDSEIDAALDERAPARSFFLQPTLRVARALLGMVLVHDAPEGRTAGRIVEVEAYRGPGDRAAHTWNGRRTPRNEVMWGAPGHAYVYFVYGMHWCVNVTTQEAGVPEAVLIRALEPLVGLDRMRARRGLPATAPDWRLCRGPGALCQALGIGRTQNGADLRAGPLRLLDGTPVPARAVARTPRIGVGYAGAHAVLPWRFALRESRAVSGPRLAAAATQRRRRADAVAARRTSR
ncbi:MAG: DNA-3-methyladenine glycosylase [bacterium]|nr:DNA-3-methyladenine glycosylase [bacterium]